MRSSGVGRPRSRFASRSTEFVLRHFANLLRAFFLRSNSRRVSTPLDSPADNLNRLCQLLRAMSPFGAWVFAIVFGVSAILGYCVLAFVANSVLPNSLYRDGFQFYSFLLVAVLMITCGTPILFLYLSRPLLYRLLLMKPDRGDWVRMVFSDTATNFVPAAFVAVTGLIACAWYAPSKIWPAPHAAMAMTAGLACVYSNSLLMMSFSMGLELFKMVVYQVIGLALCLGLIPMVLLILDSTKILSGALQFAAFPSAWWVMMFVDAALVYGVARFRWLTCDLDWR